MRFLLRADASRTGGTGHVMRCLTLAEELEARGHSVSLMGDLGGVPWLERQVAQMGIQAIPVEPDSLDAERIARMADAAVVDSYRIDPGAVTQLTTLVPSLAIVDGDSRGITATRYLDQNLGAEASTWPPEVASRLLGGARFALVRKAFIAQRRTCVPSATRPPHIVAFMGGTDPRGAITRVADSLVRAVPGSPLTIVAGLERHAELADVIASHGNARILAPTPELPALLGDADVVVAAAGTSAWDICTMGRAAVFVALVDNQLDSLRRLVDSELGRGVDAVGDLDAVESVGPMVAHLAADAEERCRLVDRCQVVFDGRGVERVADEMELMAGGPR